MNQTSLLEKSTPKSGGKLQKLKSLLENSSFLWRKNQNSLVFSREQNETTSSKISQKKFSLTPLKEKPVNLLFSLDQFLFQFSKQNYQQKKGEFFQQLKERKKLSFFYGNLSYKQIKNLFAHANEKKGPVSKNLLCLLERRLDITLYRSGLVTSIAEARQLIIHNKIQVNSQEITIPSYSLNPGDVISFSQNGVEKRIQKMLEKAPKKRTVYNRFYGDFIKYVRELKSQNYRNYKKKKDRYTSKTIKMIAQYFLIKLYPKASGNVMSENQNNPLKSRKAVSQKNHGENIRDIWSLNYQQRKAKSLKQRRYQKHNTPSSQNFKHFLYLILSIFTNSNGTPKSQALSKKFQRDLKNFILRQNHQSQKSLFTGDFRRVRPLHLEISYKLFSIIYLYSPQRINFPFFINFDLLQRSFH